MLICMVIGERSGDPGPFWIIDVRQLGSPGAVSTYTFCSSESMPCYERRLQLWPTAMAYSYSKPLASFLDALFHSASHRVTPFLDQERVGNLVWWLSFEVPSRLADHQPRVPI